MSLLRGRGGRSGAWCSDKINAWCNFLVHVRLEPDIRVKLKVKFKVRVGVRWRSLLERELSRNSIERIRITVRVRVRVTSASTLSDDSKSETAIDRPVMMGTVESKTPMKVELMC